MSFCVAGQRTYPNRFCHRRDSDINATQEFLRHRGYEDCVLHGGAITSSQTQAILKTKIARLAPFYYWHPAGSDREFPRFMSSCRVTGSRQASSPQIRRNRRLLTNQTQISRSSSPGNNPRMSSFFSPRKGGWRQPSQRPEKLSYKQMALANTPSADPHNLEANAVLGPVMWQCCCDCRQSQR
jgi:hypothetical protein